MPEIFVTKNPVDKETEKQTVTDIPPAWLSACGDNNTDNLPVCVCKTTATSIRKVKWVMPGTGKSFPGKSLAIVETGFFIDPEDIGSVKI